MAEDTREGCDVLFDSEPPLRWPNDCAPPDYQKTAKAEKLPLRQLSLSEALKRAESAARIPNVTVPIVELQVSEVVSRQLEGAVGSKDGGRQPAVRIRSLKVSQKQATSFFAGIGAVTLGKFAIVSVLSSVSWSVIEARVDHKTLAGDVGNPNRSSVAITVDEAGATLRRFVFTSNNAFADAAAAMRAQAEVSLADP